MILELRVSKAGEWQLVMSRRRCLLFEAISGDSCGRVLSACLEKGVVPLSALKGGLAFLVAALLVSCVVGGQAGVSEFTARSKVPAK